MKSKIAALLLSAILLTSCGSSTQIGYVNNCGCGKTTEIPLVFIEKTSSHRIYYNIETNVTYVFIEQKDSYSGTTIDVRVEVYDANGNLISEKGKAG